MGVFSHPAAPIHEAPRLIPSKAAAVVSTPSDAVGVAQLLEAGRQQEAIPAPALLPTARRTEALPVPDNRLPLSSRAPRAPEEPATALLPTARRSDPWPVQGLPEGPRRPQTGLPEEGPVFVPSRAPALPSAQESDLALLRARRAEEPAARIEMPFSRAPAPLFAPPEADLALLTARSTFLPLEAPQAAWFLHSAVPATPVETGQLNLVDVGFHDARLIASGDPDVIAAAFRNVIDVPMRGTQDVPFWEVRDLA